MNLSKIESFSFTHTHTSTQRMGNVCSQNQMDKKQSGECFKKTLKLSERVMIKDILL